MTALLAIAAHPHARGRKSRRGIDLGRRRACKFLAATACAAQAPPAIASWLDTGIAQALHALARAQGISDGHAGRKLDVFFDLRCPACQLLYLATRRAVRAGVLRMYWIPVAILGRDSLLAAARLIAASDRHRALAQAWGASPAQGTPGSAQVARDSLIAVLANTQLLLSAAHGVARTPSLLASRADGSAVLTPGMSPNLLEALGAAR